MTRRQAKRAVIAGGILLPFLLLAAVYAWNVRKTDQQRREALAALGTPASAELYTDLQTAKENRTPELLEKFYDLAGSQFTLAEALEHIQMTQSIIDSVEIALYATHKNEFEMLQNKLEKSSSGDTALTDEDYRWLEATLTPQLAAYERTVAFSATPGPYYLLKLDDGVNMQLPHLSSVRNIARSLLWFARLQAHHGEYNEAADSIVAAIRIGDKFSLEPLLISQHLRCQITKEAMAAIETIFPHGALPVGAREMLLSIPDPSRYRAQLADSIRMDGIDFSALFDATRQHGEPSLTDFLAYRRGSFTARVYFSPLGKALMNRDEYHLLRITKEIADSIEKHPYRPYDTPQAHEHTIDLLSSFYFATNTSLYTPMRHIRGQLRVEAEVRLMKLGLLIETYKDKNGRFPDELEEIAAPHDISTTDPFTGESFLYKIQQDVFLLYSLGENETDEDGRHDLADGDIVWRGKEL